MKLRQTIYNSIGLGLAGVCALSLLGRILRLARMNAIPSRHPVEFLFSLVVSAMIIGLVGGGSLLNLVKGRLQTRATIAMIITYCLTIILLPLGIWGIIELQANEKRRGRRQEVETHDRAESSIFSTSFLRRAATMSWVLSAGGFVFAVLCGSTHIRPLIDIAVLTYFLAVVLSLILGTVALCGVRKHGKKGILIPSLFGVSVSGLIILFFGAALIAGFMEFKEETRQRQADAVQNAAAGQTNMVPKSPSN